MKQLQENREVSPIPSWRSSNRLRRIIRPPTLRAPGAHLVPCRPSEASHPVSNAAAWAWFVIVLGVMLAASYLIWVKLGP
jgi:hypothetical protein